MLRKILMKHLSIMLKKSLDKAIMFNESFNEIIGRIENNPFPFPILLKDFRKALLGKPFYYKVTFRKTTEFVYVIALVPDKRHPDFWKERM